MFGWSDRILRIDLSKGEAYDEPIGEYKGSFIGGRGINAKVIFDELDSKISPFDPKNKILIGPGVLTGTMAPSASRTQLTTILPNGFLASSGIGGFLGAEIRHAGYDNIIIQGKEESPGYIFINDTGVEFKDASHLWGKDTQETQQLIKKELNDADVQIMCIGVAGENLVSFSCIMTGLSSSAGHGGFGAIMGSKNLKAIAIRGKRSINIAKLDEFLEVCLETQNLIKESPGWQAMISSGGRTNAPDGVRAGMSTLGNLEEVANNESLAEELDKRGSKFWNKYRIGRTGCAGCPVHHFYVFNVPDFGIGAPKCVAWISFATPLWNTDYELMFHAGSLCNQYGLDFTSTANIIGFLMDMYNKGIISENDTDNIAMRRGDREAIIATIHKIARQEGFGILLRNGLLKAAQSIGKGAEEYALQVKGREMDIQEIRPHKGTALAYAVCKDPLDAVPIAEMAWYESKEFAEKLAYDLCGSKEAANPDSYEKKASLVITMEDRIIAAEMLGICKWFLLNLTPFLEIPARLLSLATGVDTNESDLLTSAERVRTLERAVNVIQGLGREDDTLPKRLFKAAVPSGRSKGAKLDQQKFDMMVDEYYALSGFDKNGVPKKDIFIKLGLEKEWEVFSKRIHVQVKING